MFFRFTLFLLVLSTSGAWAETTSPSSEAVASSVSAPIGEVSGAAALPEDMAQQGAIIEDGIAFQPSPEYSYDPNNRRDPFRPWGQQQFVPAPVEKIDEVNTSGGQQAPAPQVPSEPQSPLQSFDVAQFKLMGIIWNVKNPKAVVMDPLKKQHIVFRYTKIGRNNGFVATIREGGIVIVEPTIGENGLPSAITRVLELKK
jgi:Tfp pilus assembly protein PilP